MQWTFDVAVLNECRILAEERYDGARFEDLPLRYQKDIKADAEASVIAEIERNHV
jgi:hypothetical protein